MKRKLSSWPSIVIAYFEGGKMSPSLVEFNQNNFFFFNVTVCWEQKQKTKGVIWVFVALSWQHDPLTLS